MFLGQKKTPLCWSTSPESRWKSREPETEELQSRSMFRARQLVEEGRPRTVHRSLPKIGPVVAF